MEIDPRDFQAIYGHCSAEYGLRAIRQPLASASGRYSSYRRRSLIRK